MKSPLHEEVRIHISPSTLVGQVTKLEDAFKEAEKWHQNTPDVVDVKSRWVDQHNKYFLQNFDAHVETLKVP